jgi:hypothetical protein
MDLMPIPSVSGGPNSEGTEFAMLAGRKFGQARHDVDQAPCGVFLLRPVDDVTLGVKIVHSGVFRNLLGEVAGEYQRETRKFHINFIWLRDGSGGQRGIRTLETVPRLHTFQACAFDHSATCPWRGV